MEAGQGVAWQGRPVLAQNGQREETDRVTNQMTCLGMFCGEERNPGLGRKFGTRIWVEGF
jgi:hypothetical protein